MNQEEALAGHVHLVSAPARAATDAPAPASGSRANRHPAQRNANESTGLTASAEFELSDASNLSVEPSEDEGVIHLVRRHSSGQVLWGVSLTRDDAHRLAGILLDASALHGS